MAPVDERRRQALGRLAALAGLSLAAWPWPAQAGSQIEEPLSHAVRTALSAAVADAAPPEPVLRTLADQQAYAQWQAASSQRLQRYKNHPVERQEFLQTLWYEARRAGLPYVYLGYWVPGSRKMGYKANFTAVEIFKNGAWMDLGDPADHADQAHPLAVDPIAEQVARITLPDTRQL